MKKRFLYVGLAALAWGVLYALGMVDLGSLVAIPIFGAAVQPNLYDGTQAGIHRGGYLRFIQVDNDGAVWSTADMMTNDTLSCYESGYLDDLEVIKTESATPVIDVNGAVINHSIKQDQILLQGSMIGTIAKYQALSTGNAVYYADKFFGSGMDRVLWKVAAYFPNDVPSEAGTNGAFLKYVFWCGKFIITNYGVKASKDAPRIMSFQFLPMVLQTKSGNFRDGGQVYQRRAVASLQAIASEDFETQAEVTAA